MQNSLLMTPNFFLKVKECDGSAAVARRQACYDDALSARGIQSLQSYEQDNPVYDHKAYTITSTYHDEMLKLYISHCMTGNADTFRHGATAYRNARDWVKKARDALIKTANEKIPGVCTESQSFASSSSGTVSISMTGPVFVESDTSAEETDTEYVDPLQWSFTDHAGDEVEQGEVNTLEIGRGQFKKQKLNARKCHDI
ncbi:hypothetical protein ACJ72_05760 [Emergomyces africanus]|uniref:Uncharacterized protein n=1 Tax=Emergomyces africanus TaxID=1955775 RepID=A0A1B7NTF0_9EURO|nr:hypothetical protein ACJ72_05760 [Emergomyces africanus]